MTKLSFEWTKNIFPNQSRSEPFKTDDEDRRRRPTTKTDDRRNETSDDRTCSNRSGRMSIKNKILETEFPLTAGGGGGGGSNPKMRRSSSTKDGQLNASSLNRQSSGSARKISTNSTDLREPLMASEWQYESARSMSRIQTSFDRSGSVSREQAVQTNLPNKVWKSNVRSASLNRTASLRKACSDESSDVDEEDSERSPLRPQHADISTTMTSERPTVLRPTSVSVRPTTAEQTTPSSTSDYHSDDVHQHRRTNSYHGVGVGGGVGSARFGQPASPVAVESNPVKWQTMRSDIREVQLFWSMGLGFVSSCVDSFQHGWSYIGPVLGLKGPMERLEESSNEN